MKIKPISARSKGEEPIDMPEYYEGLGGALKGIDKGTLASLRSVFEAVESAGHNPANFAFFITDGLGAGYLSQKRLRLIAPHVTAHAMAGHDPVALAWALNAGLKSGAIAKRSLPQATESLSAVLGPAASTPSSAQSLLTALLGGFYSKAISTKSIPQDAKTLSGLLKAGAGHNMTGLADGLSKSFQYDGLTMKSLRDIAPHLEAYAKGGHDLEHLARPLLIGLEKGAFTKRTLPAAAEQLRRVFEASAKAGHKTEPLASSLSLGIKNTTISSKSLPAYLELFESMPRDWAHSSIISHAAEAHRMGVPADKIIPYQAELAKRGHFPNAGLVKELHEIKMRAHKRKGPIRRAVSYMSATRKLKSERK